MSKNEPCPCCGGEAQTYFSHRGHYLGTDGFAGCRIKCLECGVGTPTVYANTDKEAEKAARAVWERRFEE